VSPNDPHERLATVVEAIVATGTSVPRVIGMLATVLRNWRFNHEAKLLEAAVAVMLDGPTDEERIAAWFDAQAVKERELLNSGRCNNLITTQERWLVYKASAQSVREGEWRKP